MRSIEWKNETGDTARRTERNWQEIRPGFGAQVFCPRSPVFIYVDLLW